MEQKRDIRYLTCDGNCAAAHVAYMFSETEKNRAKILFMGLPDDAKKAIEVAIEFKYSQCLQKFLNYKRTYENRNNCVT